MKSILASIATLALFANANAQTVQGNRAEIRCQPTNTAGATISITPKGNGRNLGTYSLVSNGNNQTEFRADLSSLQPISSKLELLRGTTVVRSISGPAVGDCEYFEKIVHSSELRPEEDWVWLLIGVGVFVADCVTYTGGTTTTTTDVDGNVTTTETSGQWGWDCAGSIVVGVDGTNYPNITGVRISSIVPGPLPNTGSLLVRASGGARIISLH